MLQLLPGYLRWVSVCVCIHIINYLNTEVHSSQAFLFVARQRSDGWRCKQQLKCDWCVLMWPWGLVGDFCGIVLRTAQSNFIQTNGNNILNIYIYGNKDEHTLVKRFPLVQSAHERLVVVRRTLNSSNGTAGRMTGLKSAHKDIKTHTHTRSIISWSRVQQITSFVIAADAHFV